MVNKNEKYPRLMETQKDTALGSLCAGLAHEINNPLSYMNANLRMLEKYFGTIKTYIQKQEEILALAQKSNEKEIEEKLQSLKAFEKDNTVHDILKDIEDLFPETLEGVKRIQEITGQLTSFARRENDEPGSHNLNELLEGTIRLAWNELKYKCQLIKNLEKIPSLVCYPGQVQQAFLNLILNAAQAVPKNGIVTIETKATEDEILVVIKDTGIGIPDENLSQIFKPLFTTKNSKHAGLGLTLCYEIMKNHKGRIEVDNSHPGETAFTLHFPLRGLL